MPTTSNFGWTTPADTDLVKDGAAAIRTLGNGVDSSFVDLKGGTTDQVLAKNSNTDLDFKWVTSDDANAIQNAIVDAKGDIIAATAADTPARLAVGTNDQRLVAASGEATGLKYVSDTQNTVVDAKGDLIVGTAADTVARLAVGTNGYTLVADSAETTGLKWQAASSGGANWSLLNSGGTALTGAQTVTVSGISGKDKIMVFIASASSANAESYILVRVNEDSGASAYATFATYHLGSSTYSAGILEADSSTASNGITIARLSSNSSSQASGYVLFSGCNAAGTKTFNYAGSAKTGGGSGQEGYIGGGYYGNSNTISSISIRSTSGNLDAGTVYVYTSA